MQVLRLPPRKSTGDNILTFMAKQSVECNINCNDEDNDNLAKLASFQCLYTTRSSTCRMLVNSLRTAVHFKIYVQAQMSNKKFV